MNLLVLLGATIALVLAFFPSVRLLAGVWMHQSGFTHGLLLAPLAFWLSWQESLRPGAEKRPPWLLCAAIATSLAWALAFAAGIQALQFLAVIAALFCTASWVFGVRTHLQYAAPIGIMLFAMPLWGEIAPFLQQLTVMANSALLHWMGWTVQIEGDLVHVSAGSFHIAEGCSGTHFFIVALALGVLYAHMNLRMRRYQMAFVLAAALFSIAANWFRVITIIIIGDVTDMQHYLITVDHYAYGWLIFAIFLVPLFMLGHWLQGREGGHHETRHQTGAEELTSRGVRLSMLFGNSYLASGSLLLIACFIILPAYLVLRPATSFDSGDPYGIGLPEQVAGWQSISATQTLPVPYFENADASAVAGYMENGKYLQVYVSRYLQQSQGKELLGYRNRWFESPWQRVQALPSGNMTWQFSELERDDQRAIVAHGYVIGGQVESGRMATMLRGAINALLGNSVVGAVSVSATCYESCARTEAEIANFLDEAEGAIINAVLPSSSRD